MIGSEIIELNGQSTSNPLKQMEKTPWALQWEIIYKFHVGIGLVNPKVMIFTSLRDGNRPHRIVGQPLVTANDVGH